EKTTNGDIQSITTASIGSMIHKKPKAESSRKTVIIASAAVVPIICTTSWQSVLTRTMTSPVCQFFTSDHVVRICASTTSCCKLTNIRERIRSFIQEAYKLAA